MGLDNGIIIETEDTNILNLFTEYLDFEKFPKDVMYWRKWWGPRNRFVGWLIKKHNTDRDAYEWALDKEDIEVLIDILDDYDNAEVWNYEADSIWNYEEGEIHEQITNDKIVCDILIDLFNKGALDGIEVVFYDSY